MAFEPVPRERISDRVASALRGAILEGQFAADDRLPGERQLAEEFGVNRSTIREALRALERLGLVETRQGQGTRVLDILRSASLTLIPELLAPGGEIDWSLMRDILEFRVEFNGFAARHAALRRSEEHLLELRTFLTGLEQADSVDAIQDLDFEFIRTLIRASGNRVRVLLMNGLKAGYDKHRSLFATLYSVPFDITYHKALVDALTDQNPDAAEIAIRTYMEIPLNMLTQLGLGQKDE
jgi:GntR family transcriptional regulator, transcriptional repressor for pyruvate dehydrogenase complex